MKIKRFEDLEVWQLARKLVNQIYEISKKTKLSKDFGLRNQIQRSAVSIMSNIAEGFERKSKKEFIQFLSIAKASSGELRSKLYVTLDLEYLDKKTFDAAYNLCEKISRSIAGFIKYLESSSPQS
ncbi:four helix bundle protein [candidate division TA06 bacterium B3_TA06]|uniref:Four helix bundle protein n=1 Tax=candidate division TA06 bacterium B3_TA06 TaxID=2012487 RepID=A0A532VA03_UNCT6|nr:MAG: four helix bundle protein [candidate division TA06 bacterium B3_TA06]